LCWEKCQTLPGNYQPHQVYTKTYNLIFSVSKQNIKNLGGNFESIHVRIVYAKFQPSSFNGVGGGGSDRRKDGQGTLLTSPLDSLERDNGNYWILKKLKFPCVYKHFFYFKHSYKQVPLTRLTDCFDKYKCNCITY